MNELVSRYPSLALFQSSRYHEFIHRVGQDIALSRAGSQDWSLLHYYRGCAGCFTGQQIDSLSDFRTAIENREVPARYRASAIYNMGIIGAFIRDYEFSRECLDQFLMEEEHHAQLAQIWLNMLTIVEQPIEMRDWSGFARLVAACMGDPVARLRAQNMFGVAAIHTGQFEACEQLQEMQGGLSGVVSLSCLTALFEHALQTDNLERASAIVLQVRNEVSGVRVKPFQKYMALRLGEAQGEAHHHLLHRAREVIQAFDGSQDIAAGVAVAYCSELVRRSGTEGELMIPSKYGIAGISKAIMRFRLLLERYASSKEAVLIEGESGTGKELAARALHAASDRSARPFIVVNCPAIPAGLFESALFGHVRGAFTGADQDHQGLISQAGAGTLFLDEVGDLPAEMQAKLLRFLESGEYHKVGDQTMQYSSARVIAASNQNLRHDSRFRSELYHRLRRLVLVVPSLAERREDVIYLARYRIRELNRRYSQYKTLSTEVETVLTQAEYQGNVRELFHIVDAGWHNAILTIEKQHLPVQYSSLNYAGSHRLNAVRQEMPMDSRELVGEEGMSADEKPRSIRVNFAEATGWDMDFEGGSMPLRSLQDQAACWAVRAAMDHFDGDVSETARFLGVSRRSVYRYLQKDREGIDPEAEL